MIIIIISRHGFNGEKTNKKTLKNLSIKMIYKSIFLCETSINVYQRKKENGGGMGAGLDCRV